MNLGIDPSEIVACAIRPGGSWSYLSSLVGFVIVAWFVLPSRGRTLSPSPSPSSSPSSASVRRRR